MANMIWLWLEGEGLVDAGDAGDAGEDERLFDHFVCFAGLKIAEDQRCSNPQETGLWWLMFFGGDTG